MTLVEKGVVNGNPDGTFRPHDPVKVDEFLKMLLSAMGNKIRNGSKYWAEPWIEKAKTAALIKGWEFDRYDKPLKRHLTALLCVRAVSPDEIPKNWLEYSKLVEDRLDYSDNFDYEQTTEVHNSMYKAYSMGIMSGYPDRKFRPSNTITRSEASAVIMRIIDPSRRKIPPLVVQATVKAKPDKEFEDFINNDPEAARYASVEYMRADDGVIVFKNGGYGENIPYDDKFKDINKLTYNLIKTLVAHARKNGHYVYAKCVHPYEGPMIYYCRREIKPNMDRREIIENSKAFRVDLLAKPQIDPFVKEFYVEREMPKYPTYLRWFMGVLWNTSGDMTFEEAKKVNFTVPEYKEALMDAFKAVYGTRTGVKIGEYFVGKYQKTYGLFLAKKNTADNSVDFIDGYEIANRIAKEGLIVRLGTNYKN